MMERPWNQISLLLGLFTLKHPHCNSAGLDDTQSHLAILTPLKFSSSWELGEKAVQQAINDLCSHFSLVFAVCYRICWIFLISPSDPDFPDSITSHAGLISWREETPAPVSESCATARVLQADVSTGVGWGLFAWMNYDPQFSVITFSICYWFCC